MSSLRFTNCYLNRIYAASLVRWLSHNAPYGGRLCVSPTYFITDSLSCHSSCLNEDISY